MTSRASFQNFPGVYQLMGSKLGQTLQTGVLFASSLCVITEIARSALIGPAAAIYPALYGTSIILAWMGRGAVRELAKYQGAMQKAAVREEREGKNIEALKSHQKQTETSLLLAQKETLKLKVLAKDLVSKEQDWKALNHILKESELQILKMDAIFRRLMSSS